MNKNIIMIISLLFLAGCSGKGGSGDAEPGAGAETYSATYTYPADPVLNAGDGTVEVSATAISSCKDSKGAEVDQTLCQPVSVAPKKVFESPAGNVEVVVDGADAGKAIVALVKGEAFHSLPAEQKATKIAQVLTCVVGRIKLNAECKIPGYQLTYSDYSAPTKINICDGSENLTRTVTGCVNDVNFEPAAPENCAALTDPTPSIVYNSPAGSRAAVVANSTGAAMEECAEGDVNPVVIATTVFCNPGYYRNGSACDQVGIGYYSSVDTVNREACPANSSTVGTVSTSLADCVAIAGYYKDGTGVFIQVEPGYYQPSLGGTKTACPIDTHQLLSGQTSCDADTYHYVYGAAVDPGLAICQGTSEVNRPRTCTRDHDSATADADTRCAPEAYLTTLFSSPAGTTNQSIKHGSLALTCDAGESTADLYTNIPLNVSGEKLVVTCGTSAYQVEYIKCAIEAIDVSVGGGHVCAIGIDNGAYCWGINTYGQLGTQNTTSSTTPVKVFLPTGVSGFKKISTGGYHTCGLTLEDKVYCWGSNGYGQLGNNSLVMSKEPVAINLGVIPAIDTITHIEAGSTHSCVLAAGKAYCWGGGTAVGDNSTGNKLTPVAVVGYFSAAWQPIPKTLINLSSKVMHACALASDGTVYCWGEGTWGQLGSGTNSRRYVLQSDIAGATQVSTGDSHSCALVTGGVIKCWGRREGVYGSSSEVLPGGLTNVKVLGGGGSGGGCAIGSNDRGYCWGQNNYGQFGNGTTSGTPTWSSTGVNDGDIPLGTMKKISTSGGTACAVATDNKIYCWGNGTTGSLGNGTTTQALTPKLFSGMDQN